MHLKQIEILVRTGLVLKVQGPKARWLCGWNCPIDIKKRQTQPVQRIIKTATAANDQIMMRNAVVVIPIKAIVNKRQLVSEIGK